MRQETRLGRGVSKAPEETTALSKAETPESSRRDSLFLSLDVVSRAARLWTGRTCGIS